MFGRADVTLGGKRIKSVHHNLNIVQIHPLPSNYLVRLRTSCYTYELQGLVLLMPWCIFIVSNVILYFLGRQLQLAAARSSQPVPEPLQLERALPRLCTHVYQIPISAVEQPSKLKVQVLPLEVTRQEDVIAPVCTPATTQYELPKQLSDRGSTDRITPFRMKCRQIRKRL